jgi:hypothetical protein
MDIGYFAFTRKAATEARDRAVQKFPILTLRLISRGLEPCTVLLTTVSA